jgi:hypothetical protein
MMVSPLEIWRFLRARKKLWLVPIIVMALVFGGLLMAGSSALAPFVYTLF